MPECEFMVPFLVVSICVGRNWTKAYQRNQIIQNSTPDCTGTFTFSKVEICAQHSNYIVP